MRPHSGGWLAEDNDSLKLTLSLTMRHCAGVLVCHGCIPNTPVRTQEALCPPLLRCRVLYLGSERVIESYY